MTNPDTKSRPSLEAAADPEADEASTHEPDLPPDEPGYEVDAAGAFQG